MPVSFSLLIVMAKPAYFNDMLWLLLASDCILEPCKLFWKLNVETVQKIRQLYKN